MTPAPAGRGRATSTVAAARGEDDATPSLEARVERLVALLGGDDRDVERASDRIDEGSRAEAERMLAALLHALEAHFTREEESLFPFVLARFPAMEKSVSRLAWAHDAVVGALVRLREAVGDAGSASNPRVGLRLSRFVRVYSEHEAHERALVESLRRRLDPAEREALGQLVDGRRPDVRARSSSTFRRGT